MAHPGDESKRNGCAARLEPEERLRQIIRDCEWFETLYSIRDLDLPDCWLAGGAIRNTVWQNIYGNDCKLKIKDLDVLFFDLDTERPFERSKKAFLESLHGQWVFDVKNQSSFGHWRDWHFSFSNSKDGIKHFLHTATAIGVRLSKDESIEIYAPYGLDDLFTGRLKRTPFCHTEDSAITREADFLEKCPLLTPVHSQ